MPSFILYSAAAIAEIGGCFAFWAWLRLGRSVYWVLPGVISLTVFALLLTRIESMFAGRTFAAYGGVYIAASVLWLWAVEGQRPDRWDVVGSVICLIGAGIISIGTPATDLRDDDVGFGLFTIFIDRLLSIYWKALAS